VDTPGPASRPPGGSAPAAPLPEAGDEVGISPVAASVTEPPALLPELAGRNVTRIAGFYRTAWILARFLFRVLFGLRIQGTEHLPVTGGFILASNHVNFIDPPVLGASATRRLGYVAKEELFRSFWLRHLIQALGAIPIRRQALDRQALEVAKTLLKMGSGLLLFPEGTRSRSGELGPGRPGVSMLAAEAGVPIVPAYIRGTRSLGNAFLRRRPILIRFGPPLAPPTMGKGPAWRDTLRAHTRQVMEEIARLEHASTSRASRLMAAKISG
jgi:1-acyl-sn-glycerol-3-phosphate acyltransferase